MHLKPGTHVEYIGSVEYEYGATGVVVELNKPPCSLGTGEPDGRVWVQYDEGGKFGMGYVTAEWPGDLRVLGGGGGE